MNTKLASIDWKLIYHLVISLLDISGAEIVFQEITDKPPANLS